MGHNFVGGGDDYQLLAGNDSVLERMGPSETLYRYFFFFSFFLSFLFANNTFIRKLFLYEFFFCTRLFLFFFFFMTRGIGGMGSN